MKEKFEKHFLQYWDYVKNVVDNDGWVYKEKSKKTTKSLVLWMNLTILDPEYLIYNID